MRSTFAISLSICNKIYFCYSRSLPEYQATSLPFPEKWLFTPKHWAIAACLFLERYAGLTVYGKMRAEADT
jgi:hypothetical protein